MNFSKKQFGNLGENIVKKYLMKKNWQIVTQNFRRWGGEIDIIAKDPATNELVFVEVKTRRHTDWFDLDQTLSKEQVNHIKRIAKRFMFEKKLEDQDWRIDHVGLVIDNDNLIKKLEHFEAV